MIVQIWPIKAQSEGVLQSIKKAIDYIKDPNKTAQGDFYDYSYDELNGYKREELTFEIYRTIISDKFQRVLNSVSNTNITIGYVSGYLCNPNFAETEFIRTKRINLRRVGKTLEDDTGNQAYHIVQSFPEDINISDEEVHRCGQELVEKLGLYQAVICSHVHPAIDEEGEVHGKCKHNHIIINSHIYDEFVDPDNFEKMKYHDCKDTYASLQLYNDEIAIAHRLPIITNPDYGRKYSWFETEAKNKGKSWKERARIDISNMMQLSSSYEDFKEFMTYSGYILKEGNSESYGKYVTYTTPNGMKVRDYVLGRNYTVDSIETYLKIKNNMQEAIKKQAELLKTNPVKAIVDNISDDLYIHVEKKLSQECQDRLRKGEGIVHGPYSFTLPLAREYDDDLPAERTYYNPETKYKITNEANEFVAEVMGADIAMYYGMLEKEARKDRRKCFDELEKDRYYYNPQFTNSRTNKPYYISAYDEDGKRRSAIELLFILAVVILHKETEVFGFESYELDDIAREQFNSAIYLPKSKKLEAMADALRIAREEKIQSEDDIGERLRRTGKAIAKARAEIRRLSEAIDNMEELQETIASYQVVRELCENINNMAPGPQKESMRSRHAEQMEKYNDLKEVLQLHRINSDDDIRELPRRIEYTRDQLDKNEDLLEIYREKYKRFCKVKYSVQMSQNIDFVYGPGTKKNKEKEKQQEKEDSSSVNSISREQPSR